MSHQQAIHRIRYDRGFIAAIDQSGGSTPKTLIGYGLAPDAWSSDEEMFALVQRMRSRIMTSRSFDGDRLLGAILFERTLDEAIGGKPVPALLSEKNILTFLKVDRGLEPEQSGVQLMKPIDGLERLLTRATELGAFGTKARSFVKAANVSGIAAIVAQQFELAERVSNVGLLPILEPEYDIHAPDRAEGERMLRAELLKGLGNLSGSRMVMLKLSIPIEANFYSELVGHPRVARVAALSGGYGRAEACEKLAQNDGVIASFSRALLSDLRVDMTDEEFDAALAQAIDEIYRAST